MRRKTFGGRNGLQVCLCKDAIEDRLRGSTRTNISTYDCKKMCHVCKSFFKKIIKISPVLPQTFLRKYSFLLRRRKRRRRIPTLVKSFLSFVHTAASRLKRVHVGCSQGQKERGRVHLCVTPTLFFPLQHFTFE